MGVRPHPGRVPAAARDARTLTEDALERALIAAGLWPAVADRLDRRLGHGADPELAWRLCLARTLALEPGTVLLDEPWLGLDRAAAERVAETIRELATWHTVVVAAADAARTARTAQTVVRLAAEPGGPGRVVWQDPSVSGLL